MKDICKINLKTLCLLILVSILTNLIIPKEVYAQTNSVKNRVIILTDISNEPDDQESLVRALLYSNEIDIEGIIATTSCWKQTNPDIAALRGVIDAYGKVYQNLLLHSADYPTAEYLKSITKMGINGYGMSAAEKNLNNEGIDLIISAVDKADDRPLWILSWGGANTLGGAIMKVKATRSAADAAQFVSKIRGYEIALQDDGQAYIMHNFPDAKLIASKDQFKGMSKTIPGIAGWPETWGGNNDVLNKAWVKANIQTNHGALGQKYLNAAFMYEGDTPAFLYLVPNGLESPENPSYGGWGGRFTKTRTLNVRSGTGNNTVDPLLNKYKDYSLYTDTFDTWAYNNGTETITYTNNLYAPVFRWREAYQYDMQARMDWCVNPYNQANHPPFANFIGELDQTVEQGTTINLSASGSTDPDGNNLSYNWFYYKEAGTCTADIVINDANSVNASFIAPNVSSPVTAHIILSVTDNGNPTLTRYKRIIYHISPECFATDVPAVPSGLTLTDLTCSQMKISWTDASNNEDGYKIERKTATGSWIELKTVAANITSWSNTGLIENLDYAYRVKAYNCKGNSDYSDEASVKTPECAPVVKIIASDGNAAESTNNGEFTITRDKTTGSLTINFTVSGTATNGADYSEIGSSITLADGIASGKIMVTVQDDDMSEGNETVILTINPENVYSVNSPPATVKIVDNELSTLIKLDFNENSGNKPANTGTASASFTKTTLPNWSVNVPANVGGASSLDFGTITGNNVVESDSVINELREMESFTITGWLNCKSQIEGPGGNRIVSWINGGGNGVDLVYKNNGSLQMGINEWPDATASTPRSSSSKITADASVSAANWKFFAVSYESSVNTVKYYFGSSSNDAILDVTKTYNKGSVGWDIGKLAIGHFNSVTRSAAPDRMFRGLIDEIEIYGSALTQQQILEVQKPTISALHQMALHTFSISPNPIKAGEILKINLDENSIVKIYDLQGRLVYNNKLTNGSVEVPVSLHRGIYLVSVRNNSGIANAKLLVN